MRQFAACLALIAATGFGCDSTTAASDATAAADTPADGTSTQQDIRGMRYCEILLATLDGEQVHVDVYNTFGLNDCPDAAWAAIDATQVATDAGVTMAVLNGPRYWMMNGFEGSSMIDPTPRSLGGMEMRHAGSIDVPFATLGSLGKAPYTGTTVQRNSTVRFDAGDTVFELVGPDGAVYDMQSYSQQKVPTQTEADLATLADRLTLPAGWTYRVRTLTETLRITAVDGLATIIQDDFANSYQMSNP
jgi:hypothetical protein